MHPQAHACPEIRLSVARSIAFVVLLIIFPGPVAAPAAQAQAAAPPATGEMGDAKGNVAENEAGAAPATAMTFSERVRQSITDALVYIRTQARKDEQNFFLPPIRQRTVVDYKTVTLRFTKKIVKIPIYEFETYKTVAATKGTQSVAGPATLQKVTRRRIKRQIGVREEERLIYDPQHGDIEQERRAPVYGPGGPDRLFNGFYGQNAMCIYASLKCGVPADDQLFAQTCQNVANCLDGYGLPDRTWDLAWLAAAYVNLPKDVKLYKTVSERLVNKLLLGQIRKGPAAGLWPPICINAELLAKMIGYEQKAYAREVGQWAKKLRAKKGNKRYQERVEEGKKAIDRFHRQYALVAQQGVTFDQWRHWLDITASQEFMQKMAWAFGDARVDGLPYFIYGEITAGADISAVVLFALREAADNGYLPEFTSPPTDLEGRPLVSPVKSEAVIARAAAALAALQRKNGFRDGNRWLPIHDFDQIGLPGLPVDDKTFKSVDSSATTLSTIQGYVGLQESTAVARDVRRTYLRNLTRGREVVVRDASKLLETQTVGKAGGAVSPFEYIFLLSQTVAASGDRNLWWKYAEYLINEQRGTGNWRDRIAKRAYTAYCPPCLEPYFNIRAERRYAAQQKKLPPEKRKEIPAGIRRSYFGQERSGFGRFLRRDIVSTTAAMIFLAEGMRPPLVGAWAWNDKPPQTSTMKYVTRRIGDNKSVSLQITEIGAALDPAETIGIPILFVRGEGAFTPAQAASVTHLKDYLESGGLVYVEVPGSGAGAAFMNGCRKQLRELLPGSKPTRLPGRKMPDVQGLADVDNELRAVFVPVKSASGKTSSRILSSSQAKKFAYQLCLKTVDADFLAPDYAIDWESVQQKEATLAAQEAEAAARALLKDNK